MAIAMAVVIVISIVIVFSMYGGIAPTLTTIEDKMNGSWGGTGGAIGHPNIAGNATVTRFGNASFGPLAGGNNIMSNLGTFYTLAPMILVVMAAGVILFYVTRMGQ